MKGETRLLLYQEIDATSQILIYLSQLESAYQTLKDGKPISRPKHLYMLKTLLDEIGPIRIARSLQQQTSSAPTQEVPRDRAIVRGLYITAQHAGPSTLLSLLAEDYFVVGVRRLVKAISQNCVTCQKAYVRMSSGTLE